MFALIAGCHHLGHACSEVFGAYLLHMLHVTPDGGPHDESDDFGNLWIASVRTHYFNNTVFYFNKQLSNSIFEIFTCITTFEKITFITMCCVHLTVDCGGATGVHVYFHSFFHTGRVADGW